MTKLLQTDDYFSRYEIMNLSDRSVGSGVDAFNYLMEGITKANNTNKLGSIALTVNKLTIGVTVKEWFSVFVLKDLSSPEQYFQSVFRIQTPYVKGGVILKKEGYVYDFNIDRAAALLLRYAEESGKNEAHTKLQTAKLIVKYLPIFMNGNMSTPIAYEVFYELATLGDQSKIPLSRKITNLANTTHVADEETLSAMLNDPEINDIFKKIFAHSKFKDKKQGGRKPIEPDPEKGYQTKFSNEGRNKGYYLGIADSNLYLDLDDEAVQETFEEKIDNYVKEYCPKEYKDNEVIRYTNGFKKGYEQGVNVPYKKLQCGKEDARDQQRAIAAQKRSRACQGRHLDRARGAGPHRARAGGKRARREPYRRPSRTLREEGAGFRDGEQQIPCRRGWKTAKAGRKRGHKESQTRGKGRKKEKIKVQNDRKIKSWLGILQRGEGVFPRLPSA